MRFSPITISVTSLFILARLAAASSDHVDVAAAPLPHPGQLKPTYSRFVPHHRHEGGENSFVSHYHSLHRHRLTDDHYLSKEKRQWSGSGNRAAAAKKAEANRLRTKLRQLEAPRPPPTTYRATENRAKALWGRALAKSHSPSTSTGMGIGRAIPKSHSPSTSTGMGIGHPITNSHSPSSSTGMGIGHPIANSHSPPTSTGMGIRGSHGNQAQLEKQNRAIGAKINEAWREQQNIESALSGTGTSGAGISHFSQRNAKIANLFKQLLGLYQPPLFSSSSNSATGRGASLWGRAAYKVDANAVIQTEQQNSAMQKQINALRMQQKTVTHGMPRGGRRVGEQYTRPERRLGWGV